MGGATLVDELVEGVLPVGPGFAPHDGTRVVVHAAAVFGDVLPVGLHVALETRETASDWTSPVSARGAASTHLLEVGGEAVHVLVVRQHGVGLRLEEVDVPDAQKGQQDRHVLVQWGAAEVVVLETRRGGGGLGYDEPTANQRAEPTEPFSYHPVSSGQKLLKVLEA